MRGLIGSLAITLCVGLTGCACGPCMEDAEAERETAQDTAERNYAFVFIRTGTLSEPTQEQSQRAMQGHFANMQRMAEAGDLLISGPLGPPRSEPDHRGIFVFDARTAAEGLALANTDPAREMGVFTMEPWVLTTDAPLTELPRLEKAYEQRRLADPEIPDEWQGRAYILASAKYDDALHESVRNVEGVLVSGRLTNARGGDRLLLWLDAENADAGRQFLPEAEWTMHGWYVSPTLAELPGIESES